MEILKGEFRVEIAGVVISVSSLDPGFEFRVDEPHLGFFSKSEPAVRLTANPGQALEDEPPSVEVYNSGDAWKLSKREGGWVLRSYRSNQPLTPYREVLFKPDFLSGDIFFRPKKPYLGYDYYVLEHPLEEFLIINLLSSGEGLDVHACGMLHNGDAVAFVGTSGAGKSTLAGLSKTRGGLTVLSDDRAIARRAEGGFSLYGTPWHGDAFVFSPEHGELKRIFFIKQAGDNYLKPIGRIDAASRLLARSFPTYWDPQRMQSTLKFIDDLVNGIQCYELGFLPDERALDLALGTL